jgi:chromosomal replication initiator protein
MRFYVQNSLILDEFEILDCSKPQIFSPVKMHPMFKSPETPPSPIDPSGFSGPPDSAEMVVIAWERVLRRLRAELGEDVFTSWFKCLELSEIALPRIGLSVPTKFLRNWIAQHYLERINAHFIKECAFVEQVSIGVRIGARSPTRPDLRAAQGARAALMPSAMPHAQRQAPLSDASPEIAARAHSLTRPEISAAVQEQDALAGSPLDKRFNLDNFQVGRSNMMAHAAAMQIVQARPGEAPVFNPLFVHSNVGLGKTHLMQGLARAVQASGRRVLYLTAERFMYGFVASLKAQTAIAFKEHLRGIDVLVIDDAQFLHGPKSQQEFCHTLNALIDAGRQVIVAADRCPTDLEGVDERVQSRLAGGLVVEIGALDEALRMKILETRIEAARAHLSDFQVSDAVKAYVVKMIATNGRDLEGAVNRLLAHVTLSGAPLDLAAAEEAIRDLVRQKEPKRVKIEEIQRLVANHYNVSRADLLSSRRTATVVRPRQIAMYLSKSLTLRSLPEIGRRFGGRDHTTVLHAVRKIEGMVEKDNDLAGEIDHLKRMLQE